MSIDERPRDEYGICMGGHCAIRNLGARGVTAVQGSLALLAPDGVLTTAPSSLYTSIETAWKDQPGIYNIGIGATTFCFNRPACAEKILNAVANMAIALESIT